MALAKQFPKQPRHLIEVAATETDVKAAPENTQPILHHHEQRAQEPEVKPLPTIVSSAVTNLPANLGSDSLPQFSTVRECADQIKVLWSQAQHCFVNIGRHLLDAKERLPHGEYELMIQNDLPFGKSVAHALSTIAKAVIANKVEESLLPTDYTTSYHIVTLPDDELKLAKERDLISPKTTRKEILEFRKSLKQPDTKVAPADMKSLRKTKVKLKNQLTRIEEQKSQLEQDEARLRADLVDVEKKLLAAEEAQRQGFAELA